MNNKQRWVIWVGVLLGVLAFVFPPKLIEWSGGQTKGLAFAFLAAGDEGTLSLPLLFFEFLLIGAFVWAGFATSKDR